MESGREKVGSRGRYYCWGGVRESNIKGEVGIGQVYAGGCMLLSR